MGRLESLTAWALGRTPYEEEVIFGEPGQGSSSTQQYNEHGHPRNPETKRREREHVRAANEVMQVTGVVEDSIAARSRAKAYRLQKNQETYTGLRLMEAGRAVLVGGVWGVLGLRRRILLYKPYADMGIVEIMRHEAAIKSLPALIFSGIPTVIVYHISDWTGFITQALMDGIWDEDEVKFTPHQLWLKHTSQRLLDIGFCYVTLHFRLFAILQQLNLIPGSRLFPSLRSFVPFSVASPLQLPPSPRLNFPSLLSWGSALLHSMTPMLMILVYRKIKHGVSRVLYRPIYKALPRPTGDSMFSGLPVEAPHLEYDTPDRNPNESRPYNGEDEQTLRALEGLPALDHSDPTHRNERERDRDSSDDEDDEVTHATLISFDVEATEAVENSLGTWSAELRSANEPKPSKEIEYRVTGMTMLPPILATEGLREIIAGMLLMPLEAVMVRVIGRAYRESAGATVFDLYPVKPRGFALGNLISAFGLQLVVTGIVWAGFTFGTQWWAARKRVDLEKALKNVDENNP